MFPYPEQQREGMYQHGEKCLEGGSGNQRRWSHLKRPKWPLGALLRSLWGIVLCSHVLPFGVVLSFLGGFCSNLVVQIAEKVLRFIYANVRRRRRSAM